jgi:hypothetical protein
MGAASRPGRELVSRLVPWSTLRSETRAGCAAGSGLFVRFSVLVVCRPGKVSITMSGHRLLRANPTAKIEPIWC